MTSRRSCAGPVRPTDPEAATASDSSKAGSRWRRAAPGATVSGVGSRRAAP